MIYIDGKEYNAEWEQGFTRKAEIVNGDNSGRTQQNKDMYLEYLGTFYNFEGTIRKGPNCTAEEWEELFLVLSDPINDHTVRVPFGQGALSTKIYVSSVSQGLVKKTEDTTYWDNSIKVVYTAIQAQRLANRNNGRVRGYRDEYNT